MRRRMENLKLIDQNTIEMVEEKKRTGGSRNEATGGMIVFVLLLIVGGGVYYYNETKLEKTVENFQKTEKYLSSTIESLKEEKEVASLLNLKASKKYSRAEIRKVIEDVVTEECGSSHSVPCFPAILIEAIVDRESAGNAAAVVTEKTLLDKKFDSIEGESIISKAVGFLSFGLMQVNWGWHKKTCENMFRDAVQREGGDPANLYHKLLDPYLNVKCGYKVLADKWKSAKGTGSQKLHNAVGCYNGVVDGKCNPEYASDVLGARIQKIMMELINRVNSLT